VDVAAVQVELLHGGRQRLEDGGEPGVADVVAAEREVAQAAHAVARDAGRQRHGLVRVELVVAQVQALEVRQPHQERVWRGEGRGGAARKGA
jgi:hypothetical protein